MKYVFAVLLLLSLPLARVGAQGLHGRIALISLNGWPEPPVETLLPTIYNGLVDTFSAFNFDSTELSQYDALLIFFPPEGYPYTNEYDEDTLSIASQLSIIHYLKNGGRFYAENGHLRAPSYQSDTIPDPEDTLFHYIGLQREFSFEFEGWYDKSFGVDSEFTRGLNVVDSNDTLTAPENYFPRGDFVPVLFSEEAGFGEDDIFAWIPGDTTIIAVMQYYPFEYFRSHIAEYYNLFLARVLCDYFGLCADVVTETPNLSDNITVRAIANGPETLVDISSPEPSMLEVSNVLGGTVYRQLLTTGETKAELPASLLNGIYFARVESRHGAAICSFAIVSK